MATWKCSAARNLSIHESESWDGAAAKSRIFAWAGFDGDSPDSSKARRAFLAWNSDEPDLKGSYKLPFTDVVDGSLMADSSGINAAASRLPQTDIPDDVKEQARSVLDHYQEDDNEESRAINTEVFAFDTRVSRQTVLPAAELEALVVERAMNSKVFEANPPFIWGVRASTSDVDSYYTFMSRSTLKNFAAEAEAGVSFQNSHRYFELPFGRSLSGRVVGPGNSGSGHHRMEADFFTVRGANFNGVATDQLILGIESGIIKDVSVGFYGGKFICSICNKDMFDWSDWKNMCPHIPGVEYDKLDKEGKTIGREVALARVEDAHLSEVSAVFDGANLGAAVRKAILEAEAGRIRPEIATLVENRYRIRIPGSGRRWAGAARMNEKDLLEVAKETAATVSEANTTIGDNDDPADGASLHELVGEPVEGTIEETVEQVDTPVEAVTEERVAENSTERLPLIDVRETPLSETLEVDTFADQLSTFLRSAGVNPGDDPRETVRLMAREIINLRPRAKDGDAYRSTLIKEALAAGVQAFGNDFDTATYENLLRTAPVETVARMRDDFRVKGKIPAGRKTKEGEEASVLLGNHKLNQVPDSSFVDV